MDGCEQCGFVYGSIGVADIPDAPDFGVVIVDPVRCLDAVRQLHEAGVRDVMIVSDGFKETQEPAGIRLEEELTAFAVEPSERRDLRGVRAHRGIGLHRFHRRQVAPLRVDDR